MPPSPVTGRRRVLLFIARPSGGILAAGGFPAPQVALLLVAVQHHPYLAVQRVIKKRQPLLDILMHRGFGDVEPQLVSRGFLVHLYAAGAGGMLFGLLQRQGIGRQPRRLRRLRARPRGGAPFPPTFGRRGCRPSPFLSFYPRQGTLPPLAPQSEICYNAMSFPQKGDFV